jgi:Calcineurin-like phosphoesterase
MHKQAFDRGSVDQYVEAVRQQLGSAALRDVTARAAAQLPGDGDPAAKISAVLPRVAAGASAGPEPYLSRATTVSLVQSAVESALHERGVPADVPEGGGWWDKLVHLIQGLLHPGNFSPDDPDWVIKIAEAMLEHLAKGNHPFNPRPAEHPISDTARLVVVGDWGTGLPRAQKVAKYMAAEVAEALAQGRQVHVIHLGDVYYSGLASEVQRHVLAYWPVTRAQAGSGVTSWSLNGNHDMYSGGFGYYDTLLADPRFAAQHSADGAATSFFRLTSPSWDFVGLDTSWDTDVLSQGASAVLADPQADFVASVAKESSRKLVLLSHHQLITAYDHDDIGTVLPSKLGPVLDSGRVTAWWWGHEHRCMTFKASSGVSFPRCVGHGGVPMVQGYTAGAPVPAPGAWEPSGFLNQGGQHWARFGFTVLDLTPGQLHVRYRDETGAQVHAEDIA